MFKGKYIWFGKATNPFVMNYDPCTDVSMVCTTDKASYFQSLIGIMRRMVEIGRIDIATEISLISSHLVMPREGHIEAAIHVISYLHLKQNSSLVFDQSYPTLDMCDFDQYDWTAYYGDVKESVTSNATEPLGRSIVLQAMVDDFFQPKMYCSLSFFGM